MSDRGFIVLKYMQKPSRPILKKVKQINLNNPTLNSVGMKGIFYSSGAPPLIRDELRYNEKYKDALQQEIDQVQTLKNQQRPMTDKYASEKPSSVPRDDSLRMRYQKRQVVEKVNSIPMEGALGQHYNFDGPRAIKYKQLHGYNIISNF